MSDPRLHIDGGTRRIERGMGDWARRRLPGWLAELVMFTLKQGWAALFGGLILLAILATRAIWEDSWPLARYDFLVLFAVSTQILFLWARLETWQEAKVILLFHLTGTAMEFFKVQAGSWSYPEPGLLKLLGVPLFSGFMYAAIGSYIARVTRIFEMRFAPYPPFWVTVVLATAIYVNFFAHHFLPDIRLALFAATVILFGRTRVWFYIGERPLWMPLPLAAFLAALAIWVAENIGTVTGTWAYPGQHWTEMVSFSKMGSWYLLLFVAFATVTLVMRDFISRRPVTPPRRALPHTKPGATT